MNGCAWAVDSCPLCVPGGPCCEYHQPHQDLVARDNALMRLVRGNDRRGEAVMRSAKANVDAVRGLSRAPDEPGGIGEGAL